MNWRTNNVFRGLSRTTEAQIDPLSYSLLGFGSHSIFLAANLLAEHTLALQKLRALEKLPENWDGYGAGRVTNGAISNAMELLDATITRNGNLGIPEIAPNPNGTISLEWEMDDREVYVEIGKKRVTGYLKSAGSPTMYLQGSACDLVYLLPAVLAFFSEPSRTAAPS